jgi:hypothetical protein
MAFSVNEALSTINANGGLAKSSKFMVRITGPFALSYGTDLQFFCESAQLPGISYMTDEIRMSGYGNIEKRPYATNLQDVPLTFFCDTDGRVFEYFHNWSQKVFNFNQSTNPNGTSASGLPMNSFAYPKEYFGIVDLMMYDENSKQFLSYQLIEAYPITVGDVQVAWEQSDTLLKLPITFAYTYWNAETLDQGQVDEASTARANSLRYQQGRIDSSASSVRNAVGIQSPAQLDQLLPTRRGPATNNPGLMNIIGLTSSLSTQSFQQRVNLGAQGTLIAAGALSLL